MMSTTEYQRIILKVNTDETELLIIYFIHTISTVSGVQRGSQKSSWLFLTVILTLKVTPVTLPQQLFIT